MLLARNEFETVSIGKQKKQIYTIEQNWSTPNHTMPPPFPKKHRLHIATEKNILTIIKQHTKPASELLTNLSGRVSGIRLTSLATTQ